MADPVTFAALSSTSSAVSEIGKELAKNEDFAKAAGDSVKVYAQGQANVAQSLAYGFRDLIVKNAEVRAQLIQKFGDKFINDFLANPDIAAKKFADAVPNATRSARELGKLGRDAILSIPDIAGKYAYKIAQVPGNLYTGLKSGFRKEQPQFMPPPPGYVAYPQYQQPVYRKSGGDDEEPVVDEVVSSQVQQPAMISGIHIAMIIVSIIFIIALIYWLANNGHKKNVNSANRMTNTEGILVGTGVIIVLLSAFTYFS